MCWKSGLSPRVRGNHGDESAGSKGGGSIPACAGEPVGVDVGVKTLAVYPRVCGGTAAPSCGNKRKKGLSPRVRGNHSSIARTRAESGSIPACAGEPTNRRICRRRMRVYPRVCGGTK